MTLDQAKSLKPGKVIYSLHAVKKVPAQLRVTSVKVWKTRPDEVIVTAKYGLYQYFRFKEGEPNRHHLSISEIFLTPEEVMTNAGLQTTPNS